MHDKVTDSNNNMVLNVNLNYIKEQCGPILILILTNITSVKDHVLNQSIFKYQRFRQYSILSS